jgi:hypothetical protein
MTPCNCPEGPCEHFPYPVTGRYLEFRKGTSGLPRELEISYLASFASRYNKAKANPKPRTVTKRLKTSSPAKPSPEEDGIGTELKLILESLGLKGYSGCKCKAIAGWMNRIGLQGCLENREVILAKLRKAQEDLGWLDEKKAQFLGLIKGLAFKLDKNDPAPGLLDEAIRRWREKHPEGS